MSLITMSLATSDLNAKLDFFEAALILLKKEIPKYTRKNHEFSKVLRNFALILRNVAATENDPAFR